MKDVYTNAMDAVKAPDALVEKTLRLMLEEHQKMKVSTDAGTGLNATRASAAKASPQKTRWMAQVALPVAACLCLLVIMVPRLLNRQDGGPNTPPADSRYSPGVGLPASDASGADGRTASIEPTEGVHFSESVVKAMATDNLATRSGPATEYRETGTYPVKGEPVRLLSLAYDEGGLCWVQCEVTYGSKLRRIYTGLQRFDAETFDLGTVPEEAPLGDQAKVAVSSKAMYGPGDGYDTYAELTVNEGRAVTIIALENDYAQVEWETSKQRYRAWVPVSALQEVWP